MSAVDWTTDGLRAARFHGWHTWDELADVTLPVGSGVYVVARPELTPPVYLAQTIAGAHKRRDLSSSLDVLEAAWLDAAPIVYIGKAKSLRDRLTSYRKQGEGKGAGHSGGSPIWQLEGSRTSLQVAWKPTPDYGCVESAMIMDFEREFGRMPFANRQPTRPVGCDADALERFLAS